MFFDANLILTKTKREFLVQKRFIDDKAEANFTNIMRSYEPYSYDCSLNDMVEDFSITLSSALDTVAPLKKRSNDRISPWLNNNNVNESKRICRAAEKKMEEVQFTAIYTKSQ